MADIDYEKRLESKPYKFFDFLYRIIILNVLVICLSVTIVCLFPSVVAATATLKEGPVEGVFKQFFGNLKKYFKRSFGVGLIITILYAITGYALYFYMHSTVEDGASGTTFFVNAGFWVSVGAIIIITLVSVHFELILVHFNNLTVGEVFRTSLYITFRYFLTTLILLVLHTLIIGVFIWCIIDPRIFAVWMLVGITLPIFLETKITAAIYYRFAQIDFQKIMHQVEDEDDE